jgi:putative transposase
MKKKMSRTFKYLVADKTAAGIFLSWGSILRLVFNLALDQRIRNWNQFRKSMSYAGQCAELVGLKGEFAWIGDVPSQALQQKLKDLDTAYSNFFDGRSDFPKFKRKSDRRDSIRFPSPTGIEIEQLNRRFSRVKLPKIGWVKFRQTNKIEGRLRNVTIAQDGDQWSISFNCEVEMDLEPNFKPAVGIDRGVHHTGMTSEGEVLDQDISAMKRIEAKIAKEQRRLARKTKFGKNWTKNKNRICRLHRKMTNIRHDFLHKTTTDLAKNHGLVVLEDLKVKNMTASASGTVEEPGKMVAQKSGLNRAILRHGWRFFRQYLAYKCAWYGSELRSYLRHIRRRHAMLVATARLVIARMRCLPASSAVIKTTPI